MDMVRVRSRIDQYGLTSSVRWFKVLARTHNFKGIGKEFQADLMSIRLDYEVLLSKKVDNLKQLIRGKSSPLLLTILVRMISYTDCG